MEQPSLLADHGLRGHPVAEVPIPRATTPGKGQEDWKGAARHVPVPGWPGACFHCRRFLCCPGVTAEATMPLQGQRHWAPWIAWWQSLQAWCRLRLPPRIGGARQLPRGEKTQLFMKRSQPGGIFPLWPAVVLGLACVLQHFPPGAASGRGAGAGPPSGLPASGEWVPPWAHGGE